MDTVYILIGLAVLFFVYGCGFKNGYEFRSKEIKARGI